MHLPRLKLRQNSFREALLCSPCAEVERLAGSCVQGRAGVEDPVKEVFHRQESHWLSGRLQEAAS